MKTLIDFKGKVITTDLDISELMLSYCNRNSSNCSDCNFKQMCDEFKLRYDDIPYGYEVLI